MSADTQREPPVAPQPARASFAHSERRRRRTLLTRIPHAERLLILWEALKTSFWFVPAIMSFGAIALVWAAHAYDAALIHGDVAWDWLIYESTPENAREILSTILSSMITMASLVFSITMVVLSLAANQFGPRLIRSFMASPQTQVVLGTFVMTIAYCLVALASIGTRSQTGQLPFSSVSIAVALTLVSVALLVFFLHSLARSIVSETVIERVAAELDTLLDELTPLPADGLRQQPDTPPADLDRSAAFIGVGSHGYVQAIEFDEIFQAACEHDALVALDFQAGDYIAEGGRSVAIVPAGRLNDDLTQRLRSAIVTGGLRTPVQDPKSVIQQLVEIAVRALSPGVNDPFTAVAAINRLSVSLATLFTRELPTGIYRDKQGTLRVLGRMPTHRELLGTAFDQIRQNGGDKPIIARHLAEALSRIAARTSEPQLRADLAMMVQSVADAAGRIPHVADYREIAEQMKKLHRHLTGVQ